MRAPLELATRDSLEWLGRVLPDPGARILEVGCGGGEVAAGLVRLGYDVLALDADAEAVARTRDLGVRAETARFPAWRHEGRFDAVLFARSLHHIDPLARVFERTRELLEDGGLLAVDDWSWNRVDRPTAVWGARLLDLGAACGLAPLDPWVSADDPHDAWHAEHGAGHHRLHFGESMWAGARARFEVSELERCPYFYRYFASRLPQTEVACALAGRVLAMERALIREGMIIALGMRFTGRARG